ncbi:hypothetical protein HON52_01195 [Candidatus Uhrbacteria bacterium]|jgi:hypothetical protein|nr:hypothetical protein [Candidatus Uhrbacteria bacterium]
MRTLILVLTVLTLPGCKSEVSTAEVCESAVATGWGAAFGDNVDEVCRDLRQQAIDDEGDDPIPCIYDGSAIFGWYDSGILHLWFAKGHIVMIGDPEKIKGAEKKIIWMRMPDK